MGTSEGYVQGGGGFSYVGSKQGPSAVSGLAESSCAGVVGFGE